MRPNVLALACLLTTALPVHAEDPTIPPMPEDPNDVQSWYEFALTLVHEIGGCVQPIDVDGHDNVAAINDFMKDLESDISKERDSQIILGGLIRANAPDAVKITISWAQSGANLC